MTAGRICFVFFQFFDRYPYFQAFTAESRKMVLDLYSGLPTCFTLLNYAYDKRHWRGLLADT